jgi:hypothetical protein
MTQKVGILTVLCLLGLGLSSLSAQAQALHSQSFYYAGTCTGTDQIFEANTLGVNGTVTGADIVVFQDPSGGIQFAFAGTTGTSDKYIWAGPGETHVTSFPGFAGFNQSGTTFVGGGFQVTTANNITFDLACNAGAGAWQAFTTIWYHVP